MLIVHVYDENRKLKKRHFKTIKAEDGKVKSRHLYDLLKDGTLKILKRTHNKKRDYYDPGYKDEVVVIYATGAWHSLEFKDD